MISRSSSRAVLLWAAIGAAAQTPQPPPNQPPATVSGMVTNSVTGDPVERAHVLLKANGSPNQTLSETDAKGKFSISNLAPGSYFCSVSRIGFVDGGGRRGAPLTLNSGDNRTEFKLQLIPGGIIAGRVFDADSNPMENVHVQVITGGPTFGVSDAAETDAMGRYKIGGLRPGKYRVLARPSNLPIPPETRTDGTKEEHFSPTYYGGTLAAAGAVRVETHAGAETGGVDIRLVRTPILSISGSVAGFPPDTGHIFIQVRALGNRNEGSGVQVVKDGTFRAWRVDPGRYTLIANLQSQGKQLQSSPIEIEVADKSIEHVELRMVPAADVGGTIEYFDDGAKRGPQIPPPLPGQTTPSAAGATPAPLRLTVSEVGAGYPSSRAVEVAPDGTFTMKTLQPGRYRVGTQWPTAYVKSMRLGSQQIEGDVFDIRGGGNGQTLSVMLSSGLASVSGTVKDANGPVADSPVILVAGDAEDLRVIRVVQSGKDGAYDLGLFAPGKYKVIAVEPDDFAALQGIGLDDYDAVAEKVELAEKDRVTRDLRRMQ